LSLIYWSIDAGLGLKVAIILVLSNNLQLIFKLLFANPRPYWISAQVKAFVAEGTFGIPSGHAQTALILRYLRYSLVGIWIIGSAPGLFFHFKLAEGPNR
jgi:membrane-associated phospholipid phosphatase